MAWNIPNVPSFGEALNQGINTGSSMFSRIMQPILERERLAQQMKIHKDALALQQAAAGRAARAAEDAHKLALMKMDPNYEMNQFKALEEMLKGRGIPSPTQISSPTQELGEGMGLFTPEGLENAQQVRQLTAPTEGIDLELLKKNPLLRGWFKHKFKFDPLATQRNEAYTGPAREGLDLVRLKHEYGENSEEYQTAKAFQQAKEQQRKDLSDIRARTKAGLKTGEKEFFDEKTGEPLGKEVPLTAKERESEEGNILFNELYPYVYKGAAPFSGQGSIRRLEEAAANYKTDPNARKLFDDLLLSDKMMAATTVNEASTLKSGHTNQTYNRLQASLEAQDIPKIVKKLIKEYQIPASAQLKAAMRYQQLLSDARKKARRSTPATQKFYYNPDLQAKQEVRKEEGIGTSNNDLAKMSDAELQAIISGGNR